MLQEMRCRDGLLTVVFALRCGLTCLAPFLTRLPQVIINFDSSERSNEGVTWIILLQRMDSLYRTSLWAPLANITAAGGPFIIFIARPYTVRPANGTRRMCWRIS